MSRPIRVAILADSPLSALRDGAQGRGAGQGATWLPPLAEAFAAYDDLEITWVALEHGLGRRVDERRLGQRFIVLPHIKETHDTLLWYFPARWHLLKTIREVNPDLVHVWGSEHAYPSVLDGLGIPSVYSIQGNMTHYAEIGGLPHNWFWRRQWRYEGKWIIKATVIACESPWSQELARGYWPQVESRVIEWGVHPSFYDVSWRPELESPYLLFCGGVDWRKGADILFDALSLLPDRKWTPRVAGEVPLSSPFRTLGLPMVEWLGNLKWDALKRQMAGACALVVPTRADTGPSVVKEALVVGLPVIASRNGGLRDYVVPGENGLQVDPLTPANLAAAMAELMGDPLRFQQAAVGRLEADRKYFLPRHTAGAFHQLYRELTR